MQNLKLFGQPESSIKRMRLLRLTDQYWQDLGEWAAAKQLERAAYLENYVGDLEQAKEELKTIVAGLQDVAHRDQASIKDLTEQVEQLERDNNVFQQQVQQSNQKRAHLQQQIQDFSEEKTDLQQQVQQLHEEKTDLQQHVQQLHEEKGTVEQIVEQLNSEKADLQQKAQQLNLDQTTLQQQTKQLNQESTQKQLTIEQLQQELATTKELLSSATRLTAFFKAEANTLRQRQWRN